MTLYEQSLVAAPSAPGVPLAAPSMLRRLTVDLWRGAPPATRLACLLIAAVGVLDVVLVPLGGFTVAGPATLLSVVAPLPLAAIAAFYAAVRPDERLSTIAWAFTMLLLCMVVVGPFSYLGASWGLPLIDAVLARVDSLLGFDWVAYNDMAARSPAVMTVMGWLYDSSVPQIFVLVILLVSMRRVERVREMVFLLVVGAFATAVLASLLPALGANAFYGHGKGYHIDDLMGLRTGTLRYLDPPAMTGLCQWPSFHTIISLAMVWAARKIRIVGPVVLLWNVGILLTVPVMGSHYVSDVLGGAVVVAAAVAAWRRLERPARAAGAMHS